MSFHEQPDLDAAVSKLIDVAFFHRLPIRALVREVRLRYVSLALTASHDCKTQAARILGLHRSTVTKTPLRG